MHPSAAAGRGCGGPDVAGSTRMRGRAGALLTVAVLLVSGCTGSDDAAVPTPSTSTSRSSSDRTSPSPSSSPRSSDSAQPTAIDPDAALELVRELAALGSREATSKAFAQAADLVQIRLGALGYAVHRQSFTVPAGVSWGVQVPRGRTSNIVAVRPS